MDTVQTAVLLDVLEVSLLLGARKVMVEGLWVECGGCHTMLFVTLTLPSSFESLACGKLHLVGVRGWYRLDFLLLGVEDEDIVIGELCGGLKGT